MTSGPHLYAAFPSPRFLRVQWQVPRVEGDMVRDEKGVKYLLSQLRWQPWAHLRERLEVPGSADL